MVKRLDERSAWPDHIGWRLWEASRTWQREFVAEMRKAGHPWFTDARATLMGHIARRGTRQADLIERMGITKQAVQQLIDGLEAEGVLARMPDPRDRRGRIVVHTEKGLSALRDSNDVKKKIEERYRRLLGEERFKALSDALKHLLPATEKDPDKTSA
ncbi:MarR family winged helix-turn-helix transcriptional regulator [Chelativorans alearense]|uniref:MarR family winged helix-turn-helix transcriptional regulator n=1 Tax=Chelativorans alearense TaxID=2681495 RepID=UPI0013D26190|nr:MarR family winged helix-turn-helix transcriptional regulator [Chelativorans alearense]